MEVALEGHRLSGNPVAFLESLDAFFSFVTSPIPMSLLHLDGEEMQ